MTRPSPYESPRDRPPSPRVEGDRTGDARKPLLVGGLVLLFVVPLLFLAVGILSGRDGSTEAALFTQTLEVLGAASMVGGLLAVSLVGFLRLVTGTRGRRSTIPAIPPSARVLTFTGRRARRLDLRNFWAPPACLVVVWAAAVAAGSAIPPALQPLTTAAAGAAFVAFAYFWVLGLLRVYAVRARPSRTFLVLAVLTALAFLVPFLVADPTRYRSGRQRIVLLQSAQKPILPLP